MSILESRQKMLLLWSGFVFINLGALIFASLNGKYANLTQEAWIWYSYTFLPMYGILLGSFLQKSLAAENYRVHLPLYRMAWWMSFIYLVIASGGFFLSPLPSERANIPPIKLMQSSSIWMIPMTIAEGIVFGSFLCDSGVK